MTLKLRLALLWAKLKLSCATILWLFRQWRYILIAVIAALAFFELIYWLFNYDLISLLFFNPAIDISTKISVFLSPLTTMSNANGTLATIEMWLIALIQGINIALLTYVIRHQRKVSAGALGGSSFVGLLAIIGLGCPSCGTSLITPVVALFASSSAAIVSESINVVVLPLAIMIGLYGIYVLGIQVANVRAAVASEAPSQ